MFPSTLRVRLLSCILIATTLAGLGLAARPGRAFVGTNLHLPVVSKLGLTGGYAVVFVSRQIPDNGSIYWDVPNDLPGVGAHSRFRVAAPGELMVREDDGALRTLVDGASPTPPFNLADVSGVRAVRVTLIDVSGTFYGVQIASLAEVEVIGRGE